MPYIFKQGVCKKGELYDLIINSLVAQGWQNISSNVADGDVLVSTGTTGDRNLVMQLFPYDAGSLGASTANYNNATYSVRMGTGCFIGVRLPMAYTPGVSGAAGTIKRASQSILRVGLANSTSNNVDPTTNVPYSLYADKNRFILETKLSDIFTTYGQLLHIGVPDTQYVKAKDARNMVVVPSMNVGLNNSLYSSDYPDVSLGSYGDVYPLAWNAIIPPIMPNVNGNFFLPEPYYQSTLVGLIGKIDGVYILPSGSVLNYGDIVTVGSNKFKALSFPVVYSGTSNAWPTTCAMIQIS